ncbi:2-hydroxyacid dehydrogenase [Paracoccus xiamenensis]|uniref:2-hydroxyacid dehydrogenase n=1 Tax=Paracoccus xiamenensis TaxID=2714901 RepID=UPI00140B653B|nr:2-hydroxyacid dehydrogenase [Paracoccus xiamenensis]NHF72395.1 2-hydroxyacid dehydrogenase [Paracoccus xiamenensis]
MTQTIAIGAYTDTDAQALTGELGALALPELAALAALPEDQRNGVRALAYKGHDPLGGAQMDLLPKLEVIANFGVGYDAIDVAAANARKVLVTNTPDVLTEDVADLAVALILTHAREVVPAAQYVLDGDWARGADLPLAHKVSGRRVGILGLGRIGQQIAQRMAAFNCPIHYWSRRPKDAPGWTWHDTPEALAANSDFLVIALVGGAETAGLVSAPVIAALPENAVVVNISRGSTVDEDALIAALEDGRIRGAALDVMLNEPNPNPRLLALPNVLLLPHIGSATVETRAEMGALQRRNITAVLAGQPAETPVNTGFGA